MRAFVTLAALLLVAIAFACGGGQPLTVGAGEPIRVTAGQFIGGDLPGTPPPPDTDAGADAGAAPPPGGLRVTDIQSQNNVVLPGAAGKSFAGRTTDSAVAIAMRMVGMGAGYWVLPIGPSDPQFPGELTFGTSIDFAYSIPPGYQLLRFVAVDANGNGGVQRDIHLCVSSRVPDNLNACDPTVAPPAAVISLQWDSDIDLDLQVTTPDGRVVEPKHATTVSIDAGRPGPDVGVIDRDSLAGCYPDGFRQEDLVWQQRPTGTFTVAVNMFDACKKTGTPFRVVVYEATGSAPNQHLEETYRKNGHLTYLDANGGSQGGLFVFDYPF